MTSRNPRPPRDLGTGGKSLWVDVLADFELSPAETVLLHQACRARDELDALAVAIGDQGVVSKGSMGQLVASPLLSASNAARGSMLSILSKLDVLDVSDDAAKAESAARKSHRQTAAARGVRWAGASL